MNSSAMLWTGRVLSGIFVLFMLGASVAPKLLGLPIAEETMKQLGWPAGHVLWIGIFELICVLLYVHPRTNLLGAVLTMALFGGAMATQIRAGSPLFSHILFSIYLGLFMWGGLWRIHSLCAFSSRSRLRRASFSRRAFLSRQPSPSCSRVRA
jgi:hypothetical protein